MLLGRYVGHGHFAEFEETRAGQFGLNHRSDYFDQPALIC